MAQIQPLNQVQFIKEKPNEIVDKLKAMIESGEIKQRDIVAYSKYSPGVISAFFAGTYVGDVEAIQDIMMRFYRKWVVEEKICNNSFVKSMDTYLSLIYKRKLMGKITAPFGAGKSVAAARHAAVNSDKATYVELRSTTSSASIISSIADSIGTQLNGSRDDRLAALIREITRRAKLLIVDEADNLNPRTLAILKDIYGSKSAQRCGIALIGTDKLDEVMKAPELGYLRSRISIDVRLDTIEDEEANEIADLYAHDLDEKELRDAWLWASHNHGGLRGFTNLLELADISAEGTRAKKISSTDLIRAYKLADKNFVQNKK